MRHVVLIIVLLFSPIAFGERAFEAGKINKILIHNNPSEDSISERVVVYLDATMEGGFCTKKNWAIVLNNEAAKAQYALLLASYLSGKKVKLSGNLESDCIAEYENVRNVEIFENI